MKKLFVGTNNKGKLKEIKAILKEFNVDLDLVTPADIDLKEEPIENGSTFEENAIIKAKFYHEKSNLATIADDSGLCIDALNGFPGIYSARFLEHLSYKEKNDVVLKILNNNSNRNASFHCSLAYIDEFNNLKTYEGIIEGNIATSQRGENGFGYDPIFCYGENNLTNAELPEGKKNEFSHRYQVLKKWIKDVYEK